MRMVEQGVLAVTALALSACATSGQVRYTPTTPVQLTPKSFEDVMFTYTAPAKPSAQVGVLQTVGFDTPDVAQKAIREKAAALGVDGIAQVKCGRGKVSNPFWGAIATAVVNIGRNGDCVGMAFVWSRP